MLTVAGMFGLFFMGALYMERVLGYDALEIGLAFLPATIVMGVLSLRYSERLIMRFGARTLLLPGLGLVAFGLALFTRAPVDGSYVAHVLPVMIVLGFGIGVSFPALMTLAMSGATQEDAGLASGLVNTTAQVGGALGLAVLATLSTSRSDNLISAGKGTAEALTSGYHLAFWIAAGLVVAAIVVALTVLEPEPETDRGTEAEATRPPRPSGWSGARVRRGRVISLYSPGAGEPAQKGESMGQPVVHFEIIGKDADKLRSYYSDLFGWEINADNPMNYGIVQRDGNVTADGAGIGGGIGKGPEGYDGHVTFYIEVPDVEAALAKAESLGGSRMMGPDKVMDTIEIGLFNDPEGHTVGVVKTTS